MKHSLRVILFFLSLLLAFVPLLAARAQDSGALIRITQVDNSKFPQVTLYISIKDASGKPLAVDPGQIQISENGTEMKPNQVSGFGDIGMLTTLLVMDVSGSMNNAAQAYIDQMRPGDQVGLLVFNTKVTYVQPITTDRAALSQAIKSLSAKDDTAMFDALAQADQILQDYPGRKAIIVLTDGLDNQSKKTFDEVIQSIGTSGLSISPIGLGNPDSAGPYFGLDESALKSLAEKAGGVYSYANNQADLSRLFELYGYALQSEYRITYTSPSTLRDGLGGTLSVSLGGKDPASTKYNPGGVLPEVDRPASWPIFIEFLAILTILLFIPGLVNRFLVRKSAKASPRLSQKSKSRIRLK